MKLQTIKNISYKSPQRIWIIFIMSFAAFIALSGLVTGGVIWHKQPRFCAMCHTPMNNYVQNYFGGDTTLQITRHAVGDTLKLKCVDCHESLIREQVREGMNWVTGNYTYPLEKRKIGTRSFCMSAGCHVESKIIEATKDHRNTLFAYNQHEPRHGKQECYNCHSMHGESVLTCNQCHKFDLPDGWISPQPNGVITISKKNIY
jgi:hypothetical protein